MPPNPEAVFEKVWKTIDRNYGQFGVKHVDWDALYRIYRPQVTRTTPERELWDILLAMLGHLNDEHVCLADSSRRVCAGQSEGRKRDDFSLDLVKTKYLKGKFSDSLGGSYISGWLGDGVGYLYIGDFKDGMDPVTKTIDAVIGEFAGARAMVIDVRNNPGGTGRVMEMVANRFADRRRNYLRTRIRYGPKHEDMIPAEYRNTEPGGPLQFTRPVVLLANRASASAADGFVLAMRVLPHVTVAGDLTEGALSAQFPERLPNGWTLWVSFKESRDTDGVCWDGVGVPPDLRVCNTAADVAAGRDRALEFAAQFLEKGSPAPQDDQAGLANLKMSMVEEYVRCAREKGPEAAIDGLEKARAAKSGAAFFGTDEAMQQAGEYLGRKQYAEAAGLLRACREEFPRLAATCAMLVQAYVGLGDVKAAEAVLNDGQRVEPMFPWEPQQLERAKLSLLKAKQGCAAVILGKALNEGGIPAGEKILRDLIARKPDGPVLEEADFNALGYRCFQENRVEYALFVLEKTVELYPASWNAWDSLGEVSAKAGRKERAIECYRKSLELNPKNKNGVAMLEKLEKG
ncbi:MAG: tetratricopeptide repeat protein [Acidobacteria bacterium]|nr:tetratricopeptide repeat protein [Acidobacteriota bacterium]